MKYNNSNLMLSVTLNKLRRLCTKQSTGKTFSTLRSQTKQDGSFLFNRRLTTHAHANNSQNKVTNTKHKSNANKYCKI